MIRCQLKAHRIWCSCSIKSDRIIRRCGVNKRIFKYNLLDLCFLTEGNISMEARCKQKQRVSFYPQTTRRHSWRVAILQTQRNNRSLENVSWTHGIRLRANGTVYELRHWLLYKRVIIEDNAYMINIIKTRRNSTLYTMSPSYRYLGIHENSDLSSMDDHWSHNMSLSPVHYNN